MVARITEIQSCDPQLIDTDLPSRSWGLDRLSAAAVDAYRRLLNDERFLTSHYWRLGHLLTLARKEFHRGQWGAYLKQLGIDKTRAAKAMRIYETFSTEQATSELTVAEAYDRRQRRLRVARSKGRSPAAEAEASPQPSSAPGWSQFAQAITSAVERQLEDVEFWTANEVVIALAEVQRAATSLRQLEDRLRGLGGPTTAESTSA
jgi:hypothetical protein